MLLRFLQEDYIYVMTHINAMNVVIFFFLQVIEECIFFIIRRSTVYLSY